MTTLFCDNFSAREAIHCLTSRISARDALFLMCVLTLKVDRMGKSLGVSEQAVSPDGDVCSILGLATEMCTVTGSSRAI